MDPKGRIPMDPKWVGLFVFVFVSLALMGALMEGEFLKNDGTEVESLRRISSLQQLTLDQDWGGFDIVTIPIKMAPALVNIISFDFAYLEGNVYANYFRMLIFLPLGVIMVYGLAMTMVGIMRSFV